MLRIVTGRPGQTITVNDQIEFTIKMVIGHQVWLEIVSPEGARGRGKEGNQAIKNEDAA